MAKAKPRPAYEALRRRNSEGALWRHENDEGRMTLSASLTHSHKNAEGKWVNETIYCYVEDLARLAAAAAELETKAYELFQADYEDQKTKKSA